MTNKEKEEMLRKEKEKRYQNMALGSNGEPQKSFNVKNERKTANINTKTEKAKTKTLNKAKKVKVATKAGKKGLKAGAKTLAKGVAKSFLPLGAIMIAGEVANGLLTKDREAKERIQREKERYMNM